MDRRGSKQMRHYGDITKLSGRELPFVDCIVGGSPCQDLSIAGTRKGLDGERSSLFLEQIRIVKEMRDESLRTTGIARPRFFVWENVPGAFSSNGGRDFKTVLEEVVRIAEPQSPDLPMPKKWTKSGCLYDELGRWSVAWRVHDAQFWGVPQRRKRIALVADFDGMCAQEVLFERKGMYWNSEAGGASGEEVTGETGKSIGESSGAISFQERGGKPRGGKGILIQYDRIGALSTSNNRFCLDENADIDRPAVAFSFDRLASNSMKSKNPNSRCREVEVSKTLDCSDQGPSKNQGGIAILQAVYDARGNGDGKTVCTITGDHQNRVTDYTALCIGNGQTNQSIGDKVGALNTMHDKQAVMVTAVDCRNLNETDTSGTLQSKENGGYSLNYINPIRVEDVAHTLKAKANLDFRADSETYPVQKGVVRRLTPLECERLQGYPDGWTDIGEWIDTNGKIHKESSDSKRYEALGNSIALPFWFYLMRRISAWYERPATLGSLFDGIGGFPLVWEKCNGQGTAIWASEIEEFCIAVTKRHFPEGTENKWPIRHCF